jgi:hypothetical protein
MHPSGLFYIDSRIAAKALLTGVGPTGLGPGLGMRAFFNFFCSLLAGCQAQGHEQAASRSDKAEGWGWKADATAPPRDDATMILHFFLLRSPFRQAVERFLA